MELVFNTTAQTPASDTFKQLAATEPTSRFGETFQYNNLMASAAGYIAGHVYYPDMELGAAFDRAVKEKIWQPLALADPRRVGGQRLHHPGRGCRHAGEAGPERRVAQRGGGGAQPGEVRLGRGDQLAHQVATAAAGHGFGQAALPQHEGQRQAAHQARGEGQREAEPGAELQRQQQGGGGAPGRQPVRTVAQHAQL
jgi:hypothetical protein